VSYVLHSKWSASLCGPETATIMFKQAIATKLIALAKAGERNPDILCEEVLKDIGTPQQWAASETARCSVLGVPDRGSARSSSFRNEPPITVRKNRNLLGSRAFYIHLPKNGE
jgi:hypothetical protein